MVKLADFGLAREETLTEMMTAETGTYRWMAPEVIFQMFRFYKIKKKILSFRCFLYRDCVGNNR